MTATEWQPLSSALLIRSLRTKREGQWAPGSGSIAHELDCDEMVDARHTGPRHNSFFLSQHQVFCPQSTGFLFSGRYEPGDAIPGLQQPELWNQKHQLASIDMQAVRLQLS